MGAFTKTSPAMNLFVINQAGRLLAPIRGQFVCAYDKQTNNACLFVDDR